MSSSRRVRVPGAAALAVLLAACATAEAQREPGWEVRVPDRVDVAAGATAPLAIALAVDRGLAISRDADLIVDLDAEPGVATRKKRLGRRDAVDPEADAPRFAVPVRGDAAGDHAVRLRVRFWVCGARSCRPIDVRRTVTVAVAAAPTVDAGP